MQLYIINWARRRNIKVECDAKGNLYLTKGELSNGEVYPCVTSHMDTVQEKSKVYSDAGTRLEIVTSEVQVYTDKDKEFYGGDYKHKISVDGQGIGADCKAGIVISLSLLHQSRGHNCGGKVSVHAVKNARKGSDSSVPMTSSYTRHAAIHTNSARWSRGLTKRSG